MLARLASASLLPGWVRPLADGDTTILAVLTKALGECHDAVLVPFAVVARQCVAAGLTHRVRHLAKDGLDGLFTGLRPAMRWRSPVLESTPASTGSCTSTGAACAWCRRTSATAPRSPREPGVGALLVPDRARVQACAGDPVAARAGQPAR
jgi:hypothetical protein